MDTSKGIWQAQTPLKIPNIGPFFICDNQDNGYKKGYMHSELQGPVSI